MLNLTQTTGYAILALGFLHECGGRLVLAKDITRCTRIPLPYLSKILYALTRTGLIVGKRGYQGGFALSRPADEISLCDVIEAVEGEDWLPHCPLGIVGCSKQPLCPIHDFWIVQRARIQKELLSITLADMSAYVSEKFLSNIDGCYASDDSGAIPGKKILSKRKTHRFTKKSPRKQSKKA